MMINKKNTKLDERVFDTLQERYGEVSSDWRSEFTGEYFNGIRGWQFPLEKRIKYDQNGWVLEVDVDIPTDIETDCLNHCVYCFVRGDPNRIKGEQKLNEDLGFVTEHIIHSDHPRASNGTPLISIEEVKDYLRILKTEYKLAGIKVVGAAENLIYPNIRGIDVVDFIDFTSDELKLPVVLFSAGNQLLEKHPKFGGSLDKAIDYFAEKDVSIALKWQSIDPDEERRIVNPPKDSGWPEMNRDVYLRALINDKRFTGVSPTRFGIENVLAIDNVPMLLAAHKYFTMRNAFYNGDPAMPAGLTCTKEKAIRAGLMDNERLKELVIGIYLINHELGIPFEGISPYIGRLPCHQLGGGIYISANGSALPCCGANEKPFGNIRRDSVKELLDKNPYRFVNRNRELQDEMRYNPKTGLHDCPFRKRVGVMDQKFIDEVERELRDVYGLIGVHLV